MTESHPEMISIFCGALERAVADREAFLTSVCGDNADLKARVEALLNAHDRAGDFLAESPGSGTAPATPNGPADSNSGTMIGPYKLLEQIGEGGMGTVWMAEQTEPVRRKVALKLIQPGMDSRQVLARFEAERQALALMDHPNIAKVLDAGTAETGRPYFVMELVRGVPITTYCDQHHLTPRQRLELFVPVCQAVQHAHQKGIIHRDIKPGNVLVALYDDRPVPKVIDFGVAKATGQQLTEATLHTGFDAVVGTFEYMSPEQASLNQLDVDTRSDIYSLGVLLYELLTGSPPFSRKELEKAGLLEMLRVIREQEPSKPSTKLSTADGLPSLAADRGTEPARLTRLVRGELDWIVMKALEKDRNRRYETANGLARDVERYLADEPVVACPPSVKYRLRKFASRNKAGLAVAGLVLSFIVLLGGVVGWAVRNRAARQEETAQRASESLTRARKRLGENNLILARQDLAEAKGRIGGDRATLRSLTQQIEALEAELDRLDSFLELIDRGHQTEFPRPLDLPVDAPGMRSAPERPQRLLRDPTRVIPFLLQALSHYHVLEQDDWLPTLQGGLLEPGQLLRVRAVVYEELLWLADDVIRRQRDHRSARALSRLEAARQGQAYLHKAEAAYRPTAAWHRIRAQCRTALGEAEAALADEALARDTPSTIALDHFLLGVAAFDARNKEEMAKQFEAALRLEPTHYESLLRLGHCRLLLAQSSQDRLAAAAALTGCIMKRPGHAHAYTLRGYSYVRLQRFADALADASKAIELDPRDAAAWTLRAWVHQRLHQLDQALANHDRAIELDPTDALFWCDRSVTYMHLGQLDKALTDCCKAIELEPTFASAWCNRGEVYRLLGQPDKALAECSRAIELDPILAPAWHLRALAHNDMGQLEQALTDYSRTIELDPERAKVWNNRGVAYLKRGQMEEALADFAKAIDLDPKFAPAWFNRGEAHRKLGRLEQAVADHGTGIRLGTLPKPDIPLARSNLALALNELAWRLVTSPDPKARDPKRAIQFAKEAVELTPEVGDNWNTLGVAHYRAGDWNAAIEALEKSMKLRQSGDSSDWLFLAMVHSKLGNKEESRKWYDRAVKWMEKNKPQDEELRRFRAEAVELLGIEQK